MRNSTKNLSKQLPVIVFPSFTHNLRNTTRQKVNTPLISKSYSFKNQRIINNYRSNSKTFKLNENNIINQFSDGEKIPTKIIFFHTERDFKTRKYIAKTLEWEKIQTNEIPVLFVKKCQVCQCFCRFEREDIDYIHKKIKTQTLTHIKDIFLCDKISKRINQNCINEFFNTFSINIFRDVHPMLDVATGVLNDAEWPHIELLYDCFIAMLNNPNIKVTSLKSNINSDFLQKLFSMFATPDTREHVKIADVLCLIVERCTCSLDKVKKEIYRYLKLVIFDKALQPSLSSFLFMLSSAVFSLKIRNLLKFCSTYIFPLHNFSDFESFSDQLMDAMSSFSQLNNTVVEFYITYLLSHWPVTNTRKQALFINLLSASLENYYNIISPKLAKKIISKISSLFSDMSSIVSQKSLKLIYNPGFYNLVMMYHSNFGKIVYHGAKQTNQSHWLTSTRLLALEWITCLEKIDPLIVDSFIDQRNNRDDTWILIKKLADDNFKDTNKEPYYETNTSDLEDSNKKDIISYNVDYIPQINNIKKAYSIGHANTAR